MTINSTDKKQTEPISNDPSTDTDSFTFTIEITSNNTVIVFEPKWGISASSDISKGGQLVVPAAATSGDEPAQE
jgi:hypothetical protein